MVWAVLQERAVGTEKQGAPESDEALTLTTVIIVNHLFLSVGCGPGTALGHFQSLSSHTRVGSGSRVTAILRKRLRHELAQDQLAQGERQHLNPEPWPSGSPACIHPHYAVLPPPDVEDTVGPGLMGARERGPPPLSGMRSLGCAEALGESPGPCQTC